MNRIRSIDVVRGVVMLLMAIDHVRVYAGVPAGGPDPAIFFTRWITHFVAPAFAFLAGTAAYLHVRRLADKKALSRFLVSRGLWLVLLELTVIRVAWTFNFDFALYLLAGVIWVIGWCMILMSALVRLRVRTIAIIGLSLAVAGLSMHGRWSSEAHAQAQAGQRAGARRRHPGALPAAGMAHVHWYRAS